MLLTAVTADAVIQVKDRDAFFVLLFHLEGLGRTHPDTAAAADTPLREQYRTGSGKVAELLFEKRRQRRRTTRFSKNRKV